MCDWLTPELKFVLESHFPVQNDKDRNSEALASKLELLFPPKSEWASFKQLHQALDYFGKHWGFNPVHDRSKFVCSFAKIADCSESSIKLELTIWRSTKTI